MIAVRGPRPRYKYVVQTNRGGGGSGCSGLEDILKVQVPGEYPDIRDI